MLQTSSGFLDRDFTRKVCSIVQVVKLLNGKHLI
jgi:hypothetical protein